jgi:hypothetical protein
MKLKGKYKGYVIQPRVNYHKYEAKWTVIPGKQKFLQLNKPRNGLIGFKDEYSY